MCIEIAALDDDDYLKVNIISNDEVYEKSYQLIDIDVSNAPTL